MFQKIITVICVSSLLASCSGAGGTDPVFNKANAGTIIGGAAGAWAGSSIGKGRGNIIATAAGAVLGGLFGNYIGKQLDEKDQMMIHNTTVNTLETAPSYQTSTWRNPDSGNYGEVEARPVYSTNGNETCRDFTQTVFIDGKAETAKGTACRNPDGTWDIVS